MSLLLSGQLGSAQLGAAELGQLASTTVVPPPPPPVVIMSATSGLAFGDEEIERRPVVVAKPPKPVKAKRKKRKKRKPEVVTSPVAPSIEAAKPEVAPDLTIESLTEALAEFEKQRYIGVFNTAEYLRLIAEVEQAERLRETIAEEDELILLGCFYRP